MSGTFLAMVVRDAWQGKLPEGARFAEDPDQLSHGRLVIVEPHADGDRLTWIEFGDLAPSTDATDEDYRAAVVAADKRMQQALS